MSLYNIFIDESGNFDDLNNLSLVAGFITTENPYEVESKVNDIFYYLSNKYQEKDRILHHLTQLKWKRKEEAFVIIEDFFKEIIPLGYSYFLMSNQLDVRIENPDNTYLNMLCDAVSNIIFNIHSEDKFAEFKIYPAIKKRNSIVEKHLSFREERKLGFDDIFIQEYTGLVSEKIRALFMQIGKEMPKVEIILKNARHYSPLYLSDYLCNTIYNKDKEPSQRFFQDYIEPSLKFNYLFSLTTIRNQIETSIFNGNFYNAIYMLLKAYEGIEEIGETEKERLLILRAVESQEKELIEFFNNPEFEERLEWAISYLLKNIELQSKKDKNHRRALLWYRKLINLVSSFDFKNSERMKFLIYVDKLSLLNRSGYLINHCQLIEKTEAMIPNVLTATDMIQKVLHFYNVASVSFLSMYQLDEANKYINKSLNYLRSFNEKIPELLSGFELKKLQVKELGKSLGTAGRIVTIDCSKRDSTKIYDGEKLFLESLQQLSSSESELRCYCYMVYNEISCGNGEKAYKYLVEIAKRSDFKENSDFVESFFYRDKYLPVLMLLLFLNKEFNNSSIKIIQKEIAEKVIKKVEYFSNISLFYYPLSSVLREWVLLRHNYFSIDDSITYQALYQFLKMEKYHIFPQLILLKLSIFAVEIIITDDEERIAELAELIKNDLKILFETDNSANLKTHFQSILESFNNNEIVKIKQNAIILKEKIHI